MTYIDQKIPRINLILTIIVLSWPLYACSDQSPGIAHDEAEHTMREFFSALSKADTSLMHQVTTDDFVLYEHDLIWNRDSLLNLMQATKGRIWEIKNPVVHTRGDLAHIYYYNVSRNPVGRSWYESALLVKQKDTLRLKFMHSTKLYLNE